MNYADSWPEFVTIAELKREIQYHDLTVCEFSEFCIHYDIRPNSQMEFSSQSVLAFLGY